MGAEVEVLTLPGEDTQVRDLDGKTLLPGFIDGHAHFGYFGIQAIGAQLLPPPDAGAKDIPIMIVHISGHFAVVNSKGLEILGVTSESIDPEGGLIRREKGSESPNGVLEELAAIPNMAKALSPSTPEAGERFLMQGKTWLFLMATRLHKSAERWVALSPPPEQPKQEN